MILPERFDYFKPIPARFDRPAFGLTGRGGPTLTAFVVQAGILRY